MLFSISAFLFGFFSCFIAGRYADMVARDAGDACRGDCGKCKAHCAGYHCYVLRSKEDIDT